MMTSYFNLLKYAATGIASPDMSYYDKMRASTLMGGVVKTLTGQPPLSFKADGTPITVWSMKGNGSQTGTPTPDNPVMPEFVGVRTAQLFDKNADLINCYINASGELLQTSSNSRTIIIACVPNAIYTIHVENNSTFRAGTFTNYPQYGDICDGLVDETTNQFITKNVTIATGNGAKYLCVFCYNSVTDATHWTEEEYFSHVMLNLGSTALPYEPFGWSVKLTCAGQTVPVYLGQTQTVRRIKKLVLDGTENWLVESGVNGLFTLPNITPKVQYADQLCSHFSLASSYLNFYNTDLTFAVINRPALLIHYNAKQTVPAFKQWLADEYAAGHPVTVWYVLATEQTGIVNEPLCKIGTYADELSSEDTGVSIPTAKGNNVLTIDTPIQPSEMTITYKG